MITWKQFKTQVEAYGVVDDSVIGSIECDFGEDNPNQTVHVDIFEGSYDIETNPLVVGNEVVG